MAENGQRLLTKEEVAEQLGVKVYWLNSEVAAGNIRCYRLGKRKIIRFSPEHVQEYLASKEGRATEDDDLPAS